MAPETVQDLNYGPAVDWWQLGVVLYEMLFGRIPFGHGRSRDSIYDTIVFQDLYFPSYANISSEAMEILAGLLEKDPNQRLGTVGTDEIKSHPFFASIDWTLLDQKKLIPPFKPNVASDEDTSNFDVAFTGAPLELTPVASFSQYACNSVVSN
jgi:serine/threonine protein kinase